jgi:DNA/RNA endonuclease YhcR with UshA esterase domain
MKRIIVFAITVFIINLLYGQNISPDSVKYKEGQTVTVCSKVADTHVTTGDHKTTYLNFEYGYPNETFSVVIFEDDLPKFTYVPSEFLKGKKVCVTGKVKIYKGRPEIAVSSEDQLKVQ